MTGTGPAGMGLKIMVTGGDVVRTDRDEVQCSFTMQYSMRRDRQYGMNSHHKRLAFNV